MNAGGFDGLERELDAWDARGQPATLWWRDDDAARDTPALRRLLAIAQTHRTPVAVATIPQALEAGLADAVVCCADATVVQHGYAHRNHAGAGERSAELGSQRPAAERLAELARGRDVLAGAFGPRFFPVLVPPWNRIGAELVADLPAAGFRGLSCFGPRAAAAPAPDLLQVNTHVDLIAWRRERRFIGADAALARLVAHLRARRLADVDADEPTGLLTHHLAFTDDAWEFTDALCARTRAHRGVAWLDVRRAFEGSGAATCGRSA